MISVRYLEWCMRDKRPKRKEVRVSYWLVLFLNVRRFRTDSSLKGQIDTFYIICYGTNGLHFYRFPLKILWRRSFITLTANCKKIVTLLLNVLNVLLLKHRLILIITEQFRRHVHIRNVGHVYALVYELEPAISAC